MGEGTYGVYTAAHFVSGEEEKMRKGLACVSN